MANAPVVLDHVDGLSLTASDAGRYANERRSLDYLAQGLAFLNRQVAAIEEQVEKPGPGRYQWSVGNAPGLEGVPQGLVACAFHWYAVSACNYVQLVGWLAHGEDASQALKYLKRVMPHVKVWRDKVGAHFARVKPHKGDSPADLIASVMFPIGLVNGRFCTQPFKLVVTRSRKASSSRTDMQWSLTETHQELAKRYWPDEVVPGVE